MRLVTIGSLPPEWGGPTRGGVATFHATLLEGLRGTGVELAGAVPPAPLEEPAPIPVFERPSNLSTAEFYEELLERVRPDVVLMNHIAHTIGVTHARLGSPPPAVGVVHSWHNITYADPEQADHRRGVTQEALSGLAALVTGSRHCLEEGRRLGMRYPATAEVIHYPLQPLYLAADVEVGAGERDGVLFLGSLIPRKSPGSLVEAATLLPDVEILLAGEGELESELRDSITRFGVGDRVRIVAHFPPEEHLHRVRELLLGAQVMCLPSHSESFGLAYVEALACGTPVVGFGPTIREIREAMGVEIGVALDSAEPAEVAAGIERVLGAAWDREELRRAAVDTFGIGRATLRYTELLARVSGGEPLMA